MRVNDVVDEGKMCALMTMLKGQDVHVDDVVEEGNMCTLMTLLTGATCAR